MHSSLWGYLFRARKQKETNDLLTSPSWNRIVGGPLKDYYLLIDPQVKICQEMIQGQFESFIHDALRDLGRLDGKTIWDIGAFTGYHTLAFAKLVGKIGHVVAFEPNLLNAERLRQNLSRNPDLAEQVTVITEALSNQDGEGTFVFSRDVDNTTSSGSHLDIAYAPEEAAIYDSFNRTRVETVKADTLLRRQSIPAPNVVKIDVEGAEHLVLQGGLGMLATTRPICLVEIHSIMTMFLVQNLLCSLNYDIKILQYEQKPPMRCFIIAIPS